MPSREASLRGAHDLLFVFGMAMLVTGLVLIVSARPLPQFALDAGFARAIRPAGKEVSERSMVDTPLQTSRCRQSVPVAARGRLAGRSGLTSPGAPIVSGERRTYLQETAYGEGTDR
jgi:hypothetical protein